MGGAILWMQRKPWGFLVCIAAVAAIMLRRIEWMEYWQWMVSTVNASPMLLSPIVAALVCLRIIQMWNCEPRWGLRQDNFMRGVADICIATILQAWVAMVIGFSVGTILCACMSAESADLIIPGQFIVGIVSIIPASIFGAAVAIVSESVLSVPSVFLFIFILHQLLWQVSGPQLFSPDLPTVPMVGYRLAPIRLYLEIISNLVLGASFAAAISFIVFHGRKKIVIGVAVIISLIILLLLWLLISYNPQYYILVG